MKTVILGIDLSFRKAGVCVLRRDHCDAMGVVITPIHTGVIKTIPPKKEDKKSMILNEIANITLLRKAIQKLWCDHAPDVVIIEVPYFSQSAKGSYAMGICHAVVEFCIHNFWYKTLVILPKELKDWAGSKKGDGKKEVAAKVQDYNCFSHIKSDDTLDAIGIALMHCDKISLKEYHERSEREETA